MSSNNYIFLIWAYKYKIQIFLKINEIFELLYDFAENEGSLIHFYLMAL